MGSAFWFGNDAEAQELKAEFGPFSTALFWIM